jgi:hypothetical protein
MARPSWPSPLLRRRSPLRAVRRPLVLPSLGLSTSCPAGLAWRGLLSWGCQRSPLHRHRHAVSTPGDAVAPKSGHPADPRGAPSGGSASPSARRCHSPDSFRPCRSSRLRRFAPPRAFQVCCTLKPIVGFATFQVLRASCAPRTADLELSLSPDRTAVAATLAGAPPAAPPRPLSPEGSKVCGVATSCAPVSVEPSPVARHPSELSPHRQLCRVNRLRRAALRPSLPARGTRAFRCVWSVSRPLETGHRGRCLLAVVPGSDPAHVHSPRARCFVQAGRLRSPDLKAFVHRRVRCDIPAFPPGAARCSLGLRPSRVCGRGMAAVLHPARCVRCTPRRTPRRPSWASRDPSVLAPGRGPSSRRTGTSGESVRIRRATFSGFPSGEAVAESGDPTSASSRRSAGPEGPTRSTTSSGISFLAFAR